MNSNISGPMNSFPAGGFQKHKNQGRIALYSFSPSPDMGILSVYVLTFSLLKRDLNSRPNPAADISYQYLFILHFTNMAEMLCL